MLEAIDKKNKELDETVPDLEPTPEEKLETDKMKQGQEAVPEPTPAELPPEKPVEPEAPVAEPEAPAEPETPEEAPVKEPEPTTPTKEEKPEVKPVAAPTNPPAIPPKAELPPTLERSDEWLPSKKLSTLYNNFIDFFGEDSVNAAGTVVGLEAPGLKQDSKYLQCDITADVQGSEEQPYHTWIKIRRKRNTQNWSFNNPCEVRCNCKAFSYYVANANLRNKSLAGSPTKGKVYKDENGIKRTLNFLLPAPENNPASVPALCKHLALVAKKLLDNGMLTEE
ncbi:MAG: hypothetical protein WC358_02860 [Ignavibacteria bacterium]